MIRTLLLCLMLSSISTFAQWPTITGSGNLQKENREVSAYHSITLSGSMNVQLVKGNPGKITVQADDNILPNVETVVSNGNLQVRLKKKVNYKTKNKITILVPVNQLEKVMLSGSGNIKSDGKLEVASLCKVSISGSGNIDLSIADAKNVQLDISGSGNITIRGGSAQMLSTAISGSGNIDAIKLTAQKVTAKTTGSGNIKVNAIATLDAKISGSGNVYYKGNPSVNQKKAGSGKIIKA